MKPEEYADDPDVRVDHADWVSIPKSTLDILVSERDELASRIAAVRAATAACAVSEALWNHFKGWDRSDEEVAEFLSGMFGRAIDGKKWQTKP